MAGRGVERGLPGAERVPGGLAAGGVPAGGAARCGRDGGGVPRSRPAAGTAGGAEDPRLGAWRRTGAFRRRFIAESRAAAAVDDPHIIPVFEAGESGGVLFIAMRFVAGGDLRGVLDREGPLPPGRAAGFLSPVASALDAAHRAGLVHRDVKPANILVDAHADRPDHVYLSDFGVSKGAASSVSLTGAGHFLGTPDYSAPEQIQGLTVDGRADQYALACVAFQLLAGSVPFGRDQGMAVLLAHMSEPPPRVSSRRPGLPAAVDRVLARAMAKAPDRRYGSCREFADALRDALGVAPYDPRGAAPRPIARRPRSPHSPGRPRRTRGGRPSRSGGSRSPVNHADPDPPVAETMRAPAKSAAGQARGGETGRWSCWASRRRWTACGALQRVTTVLAWLRAAWNQAQVRKRLEHPVLAVSAAPSRRRPSDHRRHRHRHRRHRPGYRDQCHPRRHGFRYDRPNISRPGYPDPSRQFCSLQP